MSDTAAHPAPAPQILCDTRALAGAPDAPAGALWKLGEAERQLDANLIHLPPDGRIDTHTEPDLDVLVHILEGDGTLTTPAQPAQSAQHVQAGTLLWLPHGSTRSITAGHGGLVYLTVHRRRPGMQIRTGPVPGR